MKTPIWGTATANEPVTITFNGQTKQTTADNSGKWVAKLDEMTAGGPYIMTVKGDNNTVTLNDCKNLKAVSVNN